MAILNRSLHPIVALLTVLVAMCASLPSVSAQPPGMRSSSGGPSSSGGFSMDEMISRMDANRNGQIDPDEWQNSRARYFLERHRGVRMLQLSEAAMDALLAYEWPGNVRELERVIERAVVLASSDRLQVDDLPPALLAGYQDILLPALHGRDSMRDWAARYARLVLERCENNKRRACRELGISYHTLQAHLRRRPSATSGGPAAGTATTGP